MEIEEKVINAVVGGQERHYIFPTIGKSYPFNDAWYRPILGVYFGVCDQQYVFLVLLNDCRESVHRYVTHTILCFLESESDGEDSPSTPRLEVRREGPARNDRERIFARERVCDLER